MELKKSNFNFSSTERNGYVRMYNSYVGVDSLLIVKSEEFAEIQGLFNCVSINEETLKPHHRILVDKGYLVPKKLDEQLACNSKLIDVIGDKTLKLTILTTEKCNFRCVYCYEQFEHGKMTEDTLEGIIKFVQRNIKYYTGLTVGWFGGEPLLGIDVIEKLSESFIKICKTARKPYLAGITTNGYLLDYSMFDKLRKLNVLNYQVTIDGPKSIHDSQRVLHNKSGSYNRIIKNLKDIKDKSSSSLVQFLVRVNFTKNVYDNLTGFLGAFKDDFSDDKRFKIFVRNAGNWGGDLDEQTLDCFLNESKLYTNVPQIMSEFGISMSAHIGFLECGGGVCYAAKRSAFTIKPNGEILKCTVDIDNNKNVVGKVLKDGKFEFNGNEMLWSGTLKMPSKCVECYYMPNCFGKSCPIHEIYEDKEPSCPVEKTYMDEFIHYFDIEYFSEVGIKNE